MVIPNENDREKIHSIIYNELVKGEIKDESRKIYVEIINKLQENGAEGVILGCTEILLLVTENDVTAILFDTTAIHAEKAVEFALE